MFAIHTRVLPLPGKLLAITQSSRKHVPVDDRWFRRIRSLRCAKPDRPIKNRRKKMGRFDDRYRSDPRKVFARTSTDRGAAASKFVAANLQFRNVQPVLRIMPLNCTERATVYAKRARVSSFNSSGWQKFHEPRSARVDGARQRCPPVNFRC